MAPSMHRASRVRKANSPCPLPERVEPLNPPGEPTPRARRGGSRGAGEVRVRRVTDSEGERQRLDAEAPRLCRRAGRDQELDVRGGRGGPCKRRTGGRSVEALRVEVGPGDGARHAREIGAVAGPAALDAQTQPVRGNVAYGIG